MSNVAAVMIWPALIFGMLGFVFGVSAYCKLDELEKRVGRLAHKRGADANVI